MSKEEAWSGQARPWIGRGKGSLLQCGVLPVVILLVVLLALAVAAGTTQSRAGDRENSRRLGAASRSRAKAGCDCRVPSLPCVQHRSRRRSGRSDLGDLNLDDVFAALDRTESTLGQHALYHRLRTAPVADHLEAFDAAGEPPRDGRPAARTSADRAFPSSRPARIRPLVARSAGCDRRQTVVRPVPSSDGRDDGVGWPRTLLAAGTYRRSSPPSSSTWSCAI